MDADPPWEVIRRAADRLEELAGKATPGPWECRHNGVAEHLAGVVEPTTEVVGEIDRRDGVVRSETQVCSGASDLGGWTKGDGPWLVESDARWMCALSPAVAEPLAAWLRYIAGRIEVESRIFTTASQQEALVGKHAHPIEFARRILGGNDG